MLNPNTRAVPLLLFVHVALLMLAGRTSAQSGSATHVVEPTPSRVSISRSERIIVYSKSLGRSYDLYVRVPPAYDAPSRTERRYPVLYVTDALQGFHLAASLSELPMETGHIDDFILVALGYSYDNVENESRRRDYTPAADARFKQAMGGAAEYLSFLEQDVIPMIDSRYRTDSHQRAYAGHSLGGLFGAYVLLNNPRLFQHYILVSPSFWFADHFAWKLEKSYAQSHSDLPARVYIAIGSRETPQGTRGLDFDMVQDVQEFQRRLQSRNYPNLKSTTAVIEGTTHETVYPTALMNGLMLFFAID